MSDRKQYDKKYRMNNADKIYELKKRYLASGAKNPIRNREPWDPLEIDLIMSGSMTDPELSRITRRSIQAIQLRRYREKKEREKRNVSFY